MDNYNNLSDEELRELLAREPSNSPIYRQAWGVLQLRLTDRNLALLKQVEPLRGLSPGCLKTAQSLSEGERVPTGALKRLGEQIVKLTLE